MTPSLIAQSTQSVKAIAILVVLAVLGLWLAHRLGWIPDMGVWQPEQLKTIILVIPIFLFSVEEGRLGDCSDSERGVGDVGLAGLAIARR